MPAKTWCPAGAKVPTSVAIARPSLSNLKLDPIDSGDRISSSAFSYETVVVLSKATASKLKTDGSIEVM